MEECCHKYTLCSPVWYADCLPGRFGAGVWQWQQPTWFLSITWCGEAFHGLGVQGVEVLILFGALFPPSVAPESQQAPPFLIGRTFYNFICNKTLNALLKLITVSCCCSNLLYKSRIALICHHYFDDTKVVLSFSHSH
jgi:hypothetical protein